MNPAAILRIASGCSFQVQLKLLRFAWNGRGAIRAFERRRKSGAPFFPAFLMLSITNRCNLHCRGCWVTQTEQPQELSLKQIQGIVDAAKRHKSRYFGILGGEPLLHPDAMRIFEANPDAYFQLYTNGTLLNEAAARRLAEYGNVTPLISLEGMEHESDYRRGGQSVFARSMSGIRAVVKAGLFTGVTASINKRNFDELVSTRHLDFLVKNGVHYIWYFIYRPCGPEPDYDAVLDKEQILALRKFIVEQRRRAKILIVDAYWDADGNAVCPGAMGISHHIAPNGALEFCPVIQSAGTFLDDSASNLEHAFQQDSYLSGLRSHCSSLGRGCILMEHPRELASYLKDMGAADSSNRGWECEFSHRDPLPCHDIRGEEIPEHSILYRMMKRFYFFGFGAYG